MLWKIYEIIHPNYIVILDVFKITKLPFSVTPSSIINRMLSDIVKSQLHTLYYNNIQK